VLAGPRPISAVAWPGALPARTQVNARSLARAVEALVVGMASGSVAVPAGAVGAGPGSRWVRAAAQRDLVAV